MLISLVKTSFNLIQVLSVVLLLVSANNGIGQNCINTFLVDSVCKTDVEVLPVEILKNAFLDINVSDDTLTSHTYPVFHSGNSLYSVEAAVEGDTIYQFIQAYFSPYTLYKVTSTLSRPDSMIYQQNLGNPSGSSSRYFDALLKYNGSWIGYTATGANEIFQYNLGSDLSAISATSIVATKVSKNVSFNRPASFSLTYHNDSFLLAIPSEVGFRCYFVNLGPTLADSAIYSHSKILNFSPFFNHPFTSEFEWVSQCDSLYGLMFNWQKNYLIRASFGNNLLDTFYLDTLNLTSGSNNFFAAEAVFEHGHYAIYAKAAGDALYKINLKEGITSGVQSIENLGTLNGLTSSWGGMHYLEYGNQRFLFNLRISGNNYVVTELGADTNRYFNYNDTLFPYNKLKDGLNYFSGEVKTDSGNYYIYDSIYYHGVTPQLSASTTSICENETILFADSSNSLVPGTVWSSKFIFGINDSVLSSSVNRQFNDTGQLKIFHVTDFAVGFNCKDTSSLIIDVHPNPIASLSVSGNCANTPVLLNKSTNSFGDTIAKYIWSFDVVDSSNQASPIFVYDTAGVFNNQFIVETQFGCRDTAADTVSLTAAPIVGYSFKNTCAGDSTLFSNLTQGNILSYQWSFGDGTFDNSISPNHYYTNPSVYSVKLLANSVTGCQDSVIQIIDVATSPNPNFKLLTDTNCSNQQFMVADSSTNSGPQVRFVLNSADTFLGSLVTANWDTLSNQTIEVIARNGSACDSSFQQAYTIYKQPIAQFSSSNKCENDTALFLDMSQAPVGDSIFSREWVFDGIIGDSLPNASWATGASGNYQVQLAVFTDKGCSKRLIDSVYVRKNSSIIFNNGIACSNLDFGSELTGIADSGDSIISYYQELLQPLTNAKQISNDSATTFFADTAFTYGYFGSITTKEGCTSSLIKNISVVQSPVADFHAYNTCVGNEIQLRQIANTQAVVPSWILGNGQTSAVTNPRVIYSSTGPKLLRLRLDALNSVCYDTISRVISVYDQPVASILSTGFCFDQDKVVLKDIQVGLGDSILTFKYIVNGADTFPNEDSIAALNKVGDFAVRLVAETLAECFAEDQKILTVVDNPLVKFDFTPSFGAPPLVVKFTNNSVNTQFHTWDFGNGDTSSSTAPQYTYVDTGDYEIELIGFSEFGCSDTSNRIIRVKTPELDLGIDNTTIHNTDDNSGKGLEITLTNYGNRDISDFELSIGQHGSFDLKQSFVQAILPGESILISPTYTISDRSEDGIYCVKINAVNGEVDDNPINNNDCSTRSAQTVFTNLFPNPADQSVDFIVIGQSTERYDLSLVAMNGSTPLMSTSITANEGYNLFQLNTATLPTGIYIIRLSSTDQKEQKLKLVVSH